MFTALALARPAHAMGSDYFSSLAAWNSDGSAALLEQSTNRDGDNSLSYTIVSATSTEPDAVTVSNISRETREGIERVTGAQCVAGSKGFAKALARFHFRGVAVHPENCRGARTKVLVVDQAARAEVERSWISWPQGRTASAREKAAAQAFVHVEGGDVNVHNMHASFKPPGMDQDARVMTEGESVDVAAKNATFLLVFVDPNVGNPVRIKVHAFISDGAKTVEHGDAVQ